MAVNVLIADCTKENPVTFQCVIGAYEEILCFRQITAFVIATRKILVFCKMLLCIITGVWNISSQLLRMTGHSSLYTQPHVLAY